MRLALVLVVALTGCSFTPRSGQFRCTEGDCPSGFECVAQLCVDAVDAGPAEDAPADGEAVDASDSPDVMTPDVGADAGPPECEADFCANFDESANVYDGWTTPEIAAPGMVSRELVDDAPSAPAVFRSTTGDSAEPGFRSGRLSFQTVEPDYATFTPLLRVMVEFRVVRTDGDGAAIVGMRYGMDEHYVSIVVKPGATTNEVEVEVHTGAALMADAFPIGTVAMGEWNTLTIRMPQRRSGAGVPVGGGATIIVNDTIVTWEPPPAVLTPDLRFDFGVSTLQPGRTDVDFDNVEVEYAVASSP